MAEDFEYTIGRRLRIWLGKPIEEKVKALTYRLNKLMDLWYERSRGLDFHGIIPNHELVTNFSASLRHASAYGASPSKTLNILVGEAAKLGFTFDRFVDIGSGKGKACLYIAKAFNYGEVVGIEFSRPLVDIANANLRKCGFGNVRFLHEDASEYCLPEGRTFLYNYNAFDAVILKKFLLNNSSHFRDNSSIFAYAYDVNRNSLIEAGFQCIYRNPYLLLSLWRLHT